MRIENPFFFKQSLKQLSLIPTLKKKALDKQKIVEPLFLTIA